MKTVYLLCLVAMIGSAGCGKKGCADINADNYDDNVRRDDGSCLYRHVSGININVFPTLDGNGSAWDVGGAPDIYVRFATLSSPAWDYTTNTATDSYAPSSLVITGGSVKFTNEDWQFQLMDYDWPSNDDVIASGTFNPLATGSGGSITVLTSNGTSVTFQYSLKE